MATVSKSARHKSAIKEHKQSEVRRVRNRQNLGRVKAAIREERELLEAGKVEEAAKAHSKTVAAIDHGVTKGVMHRNAAARKKSRLQKKLNQLQANNG